VKEGSEKRYLQLKGTVGDSWKHDKVPQGTAQAIRRNQKKKGKN